MFSTKQEEIQLVIVEGLEKIVCKEISKYLCLKKYLEFV